MKVVKHSLEHHRAMDAEQVCQRIKMGDKIEIPREVDQVAYFRSRPSATAAANELRDGGYRVAVTRHGLATLALKALILSPVDQATVDVFVGDFYALVERHNGVYNGWGGPVVLG
jgi:hypothetical protein